jgi:hypothetical protein
LKKKKQQELKFPNYFICHSIDHYVKLRDIQTVAMLCCAFGYKCDSQETFRRKTTRSESGSVSVEAYFNMKSVVLKLGLTTDNSKTTYYFYDKRKVLCLIYIMVISQKWICSLNVCPLKLSSDFLVMDFRFLVAN